MPPPNKKRRKDDSDAVTSSPKKRPRREDDDDDDDDDKDERPVPRKRKDEGSSSMMLIGGAVGGGLLLLMCCCGAGVGGYAMWGREPERKDPPPIVQNDRGIDAKDAKDGVGGKEIAKPDDRRIDGLKDRPPLDKPFEKPPPFKDPNLLAEATLKIQLEPGDDVKDIVFAEQAGRVGIFSWEKGTIIKKLDLWDWKAPKRIARITLLQDNGSYLNLSPMGTRVLQGETFPSKLNIWSLPDGNLIVKDWEPYKDQKGVLPARVAWANFLDEDRVLMVGESGRFDVWSLTTKQIIYTKPPIKGGTFLNIAPFARSPANFNLSPNRKTLAITNSEGFDFFDVANGNFLGRTEALGSKLGNITALSFDRTGTALAVKTMLNLGPPNFKSQDVVVVWDVPSGKKKHHHNISPDFQAIGPAAWIGTRHLAIHDGNCFKSYIFTLQDGCYQRECKIVGFNFNYYARTPPDDRLWYATRSGTLVAVPIPENDIAQNPARQKTTANLPVWVCDSPGIRK